MWSGDTEPALYRICTALSKDVIKNLAGAVPCDIKQFHRLKRPMAQQRDVPPKKKNAASICTLSKTGLTPPLRFLGHFSQSQKFCTLLCILIHPIFGNKCLKTFGFSQTPPSFLPKNWFTKSVPTFWFASDPPPFMDVVQIEAAFFVGNIQYNHLAVFWKAIKYLQQCHELLG